MKHHRIMLDRMIDTTTRAIERLKEVLPNEAPVPAAAAKNEEAAVTSTSTSTTSKTEKAPVSDPVASSKKKKKKKKSSSSEATSNKKSSSKAKEATSSTVEKDNKRVRIPWMKAETDTIINFLKEKYPDKKPRGRQIDSAVEHLVNTKKFGEHSEWGVRMKLQTTISKMYETKTDKKEKGTEDPSTSNKRKRDEKEKENKSSGTESSKKKRKTSS